MNDESQITVIWNLWMPVFKRQKKIEVNGIVNVEHKESYQRPHFDSLTKCWIRIFVRRT